MKPTDFDTLSNMIYVGIAAAGGAARYLSRYISSGKFKVRYFVAHMAVSAFSGYMFAGFGLFLGFETANALSLFAGMGGFLSTHALAVIEEYFLLNVIPGAKKENKDKK